MENLRRTIQPNKVGPHLDLAVDLLVNVSCQSSNVIPDRMLFPVRV